jgi:hypothetical protein
MKSNLQEELGRISELMSINEAPPRRKPKFDASGIAKKSGAGVASDIESSIEKSARRKKSGEPETPKPKNVVNEPINKKKKTVLADTEVLETLETVLGPTLTKKARIQFEGMSDETILKYVKSIESGKFNRLPEVIQEKLNIIYKKDPTWFERWKKRTSSMSLKAQAIFWGSVLFGGVYVLGVLSEKGVDGLTDIMKKPIGFIFNLGKKTVESDWKSYVKNLDNYKVENSNGVFIGTLKDVLKPNETIQNPFYSTIQTKVDKWVDENAENYTPTTMNVAMENLLKYIIGYIDAEFNSSYWVNPMSETDPLRPTLKNKTEQYWTTLRKSVNDSKNKLKQ